MQRKSPKFYFFIGSLSALALATVSLWAQLPLFDRFQPIAGALEAYASENSGSYPLHRNIGDTKGNWYLPDVLTTPIPYLNPEQIMDPFSVDPRVHGRYLYQNTSVTYGLSSSYPERYRAQGDWAVWSVGPTRTAVNQNIPEPVIYDSTNGAVSGGIIYRNQRMTKETGLNEQQ